jgi:hypothetical protein
MFNRLRTIIHRDYVVRYDNISIFNRLWQVSLEHKEYGPKFYIHNDGSVWVSYMFNEVCYNGKAIIPHEGNSGVAVYDTRKFILHRSTTVKIPFAVSNTPVSGHFAVPKPALYASSCGMVPRSKFVEALELKSSLKRTADEF